MEKPKQTTEEDLVNDLVNDPEQLLRRLGRAAADPMWADHAEVSKVTLRAAAKVMRSYAGMKFAIDQWLDKTEWVQKDSFPFPVLGSHRADVMRQEIERLRALQVPDTWDPQRALHAHEHIIQSRTDQEIVDQTNELASELAGIDGYILDGKLYDHPSARAGNYWDMACLAQQHLTATDPSDALQNLQDDAAAAAEAQPTFTVDDIASACTAAGIPAEAYGVLINQLEKGTK